MRGWIVDFVNMTITLPPHGVAQLKEIVSSIPHTQRRVGIDKLHRVLGELHSMALSLPRARGLFSQMQEALCHVKVKRVTLSTGVHEALLDFQWIAEDLVNRPMRMYELVLLQPTVDGYHNASGYMCGVVVLSVPTAIPRSLRPLLSAARPSLNPNGAHTIVWHMPFPKDIIDSQVSWKNPQGTVNNSGLELEVGVVHSDCVAKGFEVT